MPNVGYQHLIDFCDLQAVPLRRPARIHPVGKITVINGELAVPARTAPASGDVLQHVLFALQYEGTQLDVLAQVLPRVPAPELIGRLVASPTSK